MTFILTTINEGGGTGGILESSCLCLSVCPSVWVLRHLLNSSTFCNKTWWNVVSSYAGMSLKKTLSCCLQGQGHSEGFIIKIWLLQNKWTYIRNTHTNTPSKTSMTAGILKQDQSTRNMILIRQYKTIQMFTADFLPYLPLSSHHIICTSCNLLVYIIHHIIY